jgi:ESS family glutamate:Na+ symporter
LEILLVLGLFGLVATYLYNKFIAKKLFPDYKEEQFLMMYGMLTGTASTGIILLREADPDFKTPASDNMVFQNFPAIILGFPMMFIAKMAPTHFWLTFAIITVYFIVLNIVLFRRTIFKKLYAKRAQKEEKQ